jgi:FKBP-type peptidyl-prolyl cis-trans isomerase FklB
MQQTFKWYFRRMQWSGVRPKIEKRLMILGVVLLAAQVGAEETPLLKTQKEKVSYSFGVEAAKTIKQQGIEMDADLFIKGFQDGLSGGKLLLSDDEIAKTRAAVQTGLWEKRMQLMRARTKDAEENRKEGEAFLAENKLMKGVVTLPSGLQYKVLKAGGGRKPTEADTVECHYRGTFVDGTEFNSSYQKGKPGIFKVTGVIRGWKEALQLMPVGSKWLLFIPPQLAYGMRGMGDQIGPNTTLIFEIELLAIK